MNSSTAIQGVKTIQGALKVLAMLQMTAFLWPQQAKVQDGASFDFIIVGAGSAGSVIANRLTEDKTTTVLLIEAGGNPPVESLLPGLLPFIKNSDVDWMYYTENDHYSQQYHKNYGVELTRGKMLGGSSSINFMGYSRGHYHIFDKWAQISGDESWSWKNVLPYFMKSEQLVDSVILNSEDSIFHGTEGYLKVNKSYKEVATKYLAAFAEIGHDIRFDVDGAHPLGYTEGMLTVADGVRQSTAYAFLRPIKNRPNFFVLKDTLVSKILIDEHKNAVGVEVITKENVVKQFKAKKEVIVSAGAINSPQLLMLSGVGPKEHLKKMNIDVVVDLPVGQSMQDHVMVMMINAMGNATEPKPQDPRDYPVSLITGYAAINKAQDYPDYQTLNLLLNDQSALISFCAFYYAYIDAICDALHKGTIGKEVLLSFVMLISPESRGQVLLRSLNPKDQPVIYTGYYSKEEDLENQAIYVADYMEIYKSKLFKSVGTQLVVPDACGCQNTYELEYWKCYSLCMMVSGYHYSGTCAMGAVVDSRLKVNGMHKLRIADASVMPKIPGANINAPVIMIGERVSDFIKEDHNLLDHNNS